MKTTVQVLLSLIMFLSPCIGSRPIESRADVIVQGDGNLFTNPNSNNAGQYVDASWYYNNVRNAGVVGISTDYGGIQNSSVVFSTLTSASKADIEYLPGAINLSGNFYSTGGLGTLGELTHLSYRWYRDSSSLAASHLHPVIRILVDADGDLSTTHDRGGLVFELAYNGGGVSIDQWIYEDIFSYNDGAGANLWNFGAGMAMGHGGYNQSLSNWLNGFSGSTLSADSVVIGISLGVGSGWGAFEGAIDSVTIGFNGNSTTFNFQSIPEPATGIGSMALLFGFIVFSRKRRSSRI